MSEPVRKSIEELRAEYEAAKVGIDAQVVELVRRGHPVPGRAGIETKIIRLREAWARYRMRIGK